MSSQDLQKPVAVIIPTHNRDAMLARAIDSVLRQTFYDFDLIVVDDASTEDLPASRRLVSQYEKTWIDLPINRGVAGARNAGVAAAPKAKWIAFLDSDDTWEPEKLSRQLALHGENPDIRLSQVTERWLRNGAEVNKPPHLQQKGGDVFLTAVERCCIGPSCSMIRRDLWLESGGFDEDFVVCEDYDLWVRMAVKETIGLVEGEPLATKFAGHDDQLSSAPAMDRWRILALLKLARDGNLDETQSKILSDGIIRKATVLRGGADRRKNERARDFYDGIISSIEHLGLESASEWVTLAKNFAQSAEFE